MSRSAPPHHTVDGFTNPGLEGQKKSLWSVVKMRAFSGWADHKAQASQVPRVSVNLEKIGAPHGTVQTTWIGHSTYLIQIGGKNILTDPVWSDRASPLSWAGPRRYTPPAMSLNQLPPIDYVVISHNHYDHLDLHSIAALGNNPLWLVPLANAKILASVGVTNVVELDWWETHVHGGLTFTATPAQHWSTRGVNDRFACLWSGWAIRHPEANVYFAGDTGYNANLFTEIGKRLGPFELALIPIGAYAPRWFMKTFHVNPEEAVQIHLDIRARRSLAMHWGTFPLTAESPGEPPERLAAAVQSHGLAPTAFTAIALGTTVTVQASGGSE